MTVATVGSQQLAGLVDDLGIRVGHVVVIDTDIAGITLVGKDMLLDIRPSLTVVQLAKLALLDVGIALTFCAIAWLLKKINFPPVPILLGLVLGSMTETNFRRALQISKGNPSIFVSSPFCIIFIALTLFVIASVIFSKYKERNKKTDDKGQPT